MHPTKRAPLQRSNSTEGKCGEAVRVFQKSKTHEIYHNIPVLRGSVVLSAIVGCTVHSSVRSHIMLFPFSAGKTSKINLKPFYK